MNYDLANDELIILLILTGILGFAYVYYLYREAKKNSDANVSKEDKESVGSIFYLIAFYPFGAVISTFLNPNIEFHNSSIVGTFAVTLTCIGACTYMLAIRKSKTAKRVKSEKCNYNKRVWAYILLGVAYTFLVTSIYLGVVGLFWPVILSTIAFLLLNSSRSRKKQQSSAVVKPFKNFCFISTMQSIGGSQQTTMSKKIVKVEFVQENVYEVAVLNCDVINADSTYGYDLSSKKMQVVYKSDQVVLLSCDNSSVDHSQYALQIYYTNGDVTSCELHTPTIKIVYSN